MPRALLPRFEGLIRTALYAIVATVIAGAVLGRISPSFAQDDAGSQIKQDEEDILDILSKSPATALDLGLLGLRQTEIATFVGSKPQIFKRGHLIFWMLVTTATST
jgi:hypothetical protein